jgi:hypothetical protein
LAAVVDLLPVAHFAATSRDGRTGTLLFEDLSVLGFAPGGLAGWNGGMAVAEALAACEAIARVHGATLRPGAVGGTSSGLLPPRWANAEQRAFLGGAEPAWVQQFASAWAPRCADPERMAHTVARAAARSAQHLAVCSTAAAAAGAVLAVAHGDFKGDNIFVRRRGDVEVRVIDWQLCTLSPPEALLADLALLVSGSVAPAVRAAGGGVAARGTERALVTHFLDVYGAAFAREIAADPGATAAARAASAVMAAASEEDRRTRAAWLAGCTAYVVAFGARFIAGVDPDSMLDAHRVGLIVWLDGLCHFTAAVEEMGK